MIFFLQIFSLAVSPSKVPVHGFRAIESQKIPYRAGDIKRVHASLLHHDGARVLPTGALARYS